MYLKILKIGSDTKTNQSIEDCDQGEDYKIVVSKIEDFEIIRLDPDSFDPDIVLLDVDLIFIKKQNVLFQLERLYPKAKIIVLTNAFAEIYQELFKINGNGHFINKNELWIKLPTLIHHANNRLMKKERVR